MGDADAETDAGAHRGLAFFDDGGDGVAILGFDFAGGDEVAHQVVNGGPAVSGLHVGQDVFLA